MSDKKPSEIIRERARKLALNDTMSQGLGLSSVYYADNNWQKDCYFKPALLEYLDELVERFEEQHSRR